MTKKKPHTIQPNSTVPARAPLSFPHCRRLQRLPGLSPVSVSLTHLQDWMSSQYIVCLSSTMDFQGCQQKSLLGLTDGWLRGSQQWNMGPSALFQQQLKLLAEFTLQETHWGERGWKKSRTTSSVWRLLSIPPYKSLHHENIQSPTKACSFTQFCLYFMDISGSSHYFSHKLHLWKPNETLLKYKAFSLGFAEAQFLHASVVIPGDCQNSCRDHPETTKLNTTKLLKGAAGCSQLLSSI